MNENNAFITGHRPKSLPWGYNENSEQCINFKKDVEKVLQDIIKNNINIFYVGMAEGFDMICAEILIKLRKKYKIKIIAAIPCPNQSAKWSEEQKLRYKQILKQCDEQVLICDAYTPYCMQKRNMFMVDNSSVCISCWNGKPSGTGNTIKYAQEKHIKIINIDPNKNKLDKRD